MSTIVTYTQFGEFVNAESQRLNRKESAVFCWTCAVRIVKAYWPTVLQELERHELDKVRTLRQTVALIHVHSISIDRIAGPLAAIAEVGIDDDGERE